MLNQTIVLKVKERINKLDSKDFDNIPDWKILEAFNNGTVAWCRRQLQGTNMTKTGDESTKRRIDDLQVILELDQPITMTKKDRFYISQLLPANYFEWKLVSSKATHDCCTVPRPMKIWLVEEANRDDLLRDNDKKPNFPWAETFATLANNKVRIYTNNEFDLVETKLSYYRQPRRIEMTGVVNAYTGLISTADVLSEFKDDIVELFINESVKILSGDIESINISQIADNAVETNN